MYIFGVNKHFLLRFRFTYDSEEIEVVNTVEEKEVYDCTQRERGL